jgi:hypothetical protein
MSTIEIRQRLHFAIDELENEDLLEAVLSLLDSPGNRSDLVKVKQLQAHREREKENLRGLSKTATQINSYISLKDWYCFEDRVF